MFFENERVLCSSCSTKNMSSVDEAVDRTREEDCKCLHNRMARHSRGADFSDWRVAQLLPPSSQHVLAVVLAALVAEAVSR
jgi:hypothetical protein